VIGNPEFGYWLWFANGPRIGPELDQRRRARVYNQARCNSFMWLCTLDIEAHQACCPALAGIIQNRQNADYEHRHGEDDQYGGFHSTSPPRVSPTPIGLDFSWFKMNQP
jgi:hypothetical protein